MPTLKYISLYNPDGHGDPLRVLKLADKCPVTALQILQPPALTSPK